jgi:hypothetical protein
MTNTKTKLCNRCGGVVTYNPTTANGMTKGWYCETCGEYMTVKARRFNPGTREYSNRGESQEDRGGCHASIQ